MQRVVVLRFCDGKGKKNVSDCGCLESLHQVRDESEVWLNCSTTSPFRRFSSNSYRNARLSRSRA